MLTDDGTERSKPKKPARSTNGSKRPDPLADKRRPAKPERSASGSTSVDPRLESEPTRSRARGANGSTRSDPVIEKRRHASTWNTGIVLERDAAEILLIFDRPRREVTEYRAFLQRGDELLVVDLDRPKGTRSQRGFLARASFRRGDRLLVFARTDRAPLVLRDFKVRGKVAAQPAALGNGGALEAAQDDEIERAIAQLAVDDRAEFSAREKACKRQFVGQDERLPASLFFTRFDTQTHPGARDLWARPVFHANGGVDWRPFDPKEKADRDEIAVRALAIDYLDGKLTERNLERSAYSPVRAPSAEIEPLLSASVRTIGELFYACMCEHYVALPVRQRLDWLEPAANGNAFGVRGIVIDGVLDPSAIDVDRVGRAFELFASGALEFSDELIREFKIAREAGRPDGEKFFLFAEFASLACDVGYMPELWRKLFRHFVAATWIFCQRHARAMPHRPGVFWFGLNPPPGSPDTSTIDPAIRPISEAQLTQLRTRMARIGPDGMNDEFSHVTALARPVARRVRNAFLRQVFGPLMTCSDVRG